MAKSQRQKGVRGELEVAHLFMSHGFRARRGVGQWQNASTEPDVVLEEIPEVWVEVKRGAQTRPLEALHQAELASPSRVHIAITRNDREKYLVTVRHKTLCLLSGTVCDALLENNYCIMVMDVFMALFKTKYKDACRQPDLFPKPD